MFAIIIYATQSLSLLTTIISPAVEKVTEGLTAVAKKATPGALAPVSIVRRALGITMHPVTTNTTTTTTSTTTSTEPSDQIEV